MPQTSLPEETLDPSDWEPLRALGHRLVDDAVEWLRGVRERPVWQPLPDEVRARLRQPLPRAGRPAAEVYQAFRDCVLPYPTGNVHPRFWGWVMGTGSLTAAYAEFLAALMNSNVSGFDDAASAVEGQVVDWLKEAFGFPPEASGVLVSGGAMANVVALAVARNSRAGFDVRREGLRAAPRPFVIYGSTAVHNTNVKALELLGLGREALRPVGARLDGSLDAALLAQAVVADRAAGRQPLAVIGSCGTAGTGAIDDLPALADLCAREALWLHVDGAFGAWAALAPALRERVAGLERADSLAFDLHKWGFLPYEIGCTLVRDGRNQRASFAVSAPYLTANAGGISPHGTPLSDLGPQLSRSFRALKAWMTLQEHGFDKLGRLVRQNVDQAAHLAARIAAEPELELLAPVPLNIVCFRYRGSVAPVRLDALNAELLVRLQESGLAAPSHTTLDGRFALRVAITNHRTRRADLDLLAEGVLRLGRELARRGAAAGHSSATEDGGRP